MTTSMLRKIITAGIFVLAASSVPALHAQAPAPGVAPGQRQGMGTPAERAERQVAQLTTALTLTPEQVTQVRPILVKQFTEQQSLMSGTQQGGDMAALRTRNQALSATAQGEIVALLTPAQKTAYEAYLAAQRNRPGGMRGQGAGGPARQP